jgi:hypothetical protein
MLTVTPSGLQPTRPKEIKATEVRVIAAPYGATARHR